MSKTTIIRGGAALIDECAANIQEKYMGKRYAVQRRIREKNNTVSILVTIASPASAIGRIWSFGAFARAQLVLTPQGDNLCVTVGGGIWWDKILGVLIGCFLIWTYIAPLICLIPVTRGINHQNKLQEQVYNDTIRWFESRKAWLGGRTVRIRRAVP